MVVPPLPVEIIEHIIKQSLPPLRFDTFKERYELLRTFALVDSRWRVLAQRELGKHLMVTRAGQKELEETLNHRENFGRQAQSVWATADGLVATASDKPKIMALVEEVLDRSELRHLTMSCINLNGDMELFEQGRSLRSCTLHYSDFTFDWTAPTIQHLKSLYLVDSYFYDGDGEWLSFLNPTSDPSLRRLQLLRTNIINTFNESRSDPRDRGGIIHSILAVAARLEVLSICEADHPSIANSLSAGDWLTFSKLRNLTLSTAGDLSKQHSWLQTLEHLPPNLESVTIHVLNAAELDVLYHDIEQAVQRWGKKKWQLLIKLLNPTVYLDQTDPKEEALEPRSSLLRTATERGLKMEISSSEATYVDWQTFFDDW
ncbi:hypothetical protein BCR35DRAFT_354856 [Leucosporidium creatinivorum]|uniref:F-box domain-containing protein n=1 Tax=Leucosporidium creatinivorum TaxID=106004 RepID=A0A1Y2E5B1_9BASI|nr:hypothetical protein BCR35DRAFT_354856 [Leucosporidium creatinivorum]